MLQILRLLVPALIPAWNFFDWIAPSPRIEFNRLRSPDDANEHWQAFRPSPATMPPRCMAQRLLWNPRWNETLFVVSCAERLLEAPDEHSCLEIFRRIAADLPLGDDLGYLRFRLVQVRRIDDALEREICFVSETRALRGLLER